MFFNNWHDTAKYLFFNFEKTRPHLAIHKKRVGNMPANQCENSSSRYFGNGQISLSEIISRWSICSRMLDR